MTEGSVGSSQAGVDARPARSETRGFLFADIRGYTQYVERQGAPAAAELLLRYRAVVRDAITRNDGAEIRTEGDSFYVVLRSASDAVLCGLTIVKGVAEENARNPEAPIRVGVGIHAGEAIDTSEGLVGSAVNMAARVCALAGPGEVLVTDTVRGLARSVIPVTFTSRGDQRLKGLAEPIELFRVSESASERQSRRPLGRRPWFIAGGLVGAVVVAGAVIYLASALSKPATSDAPTPTRSPPTGGSPSLSSVLVSSAPSRSLAPSQAAGPTVLTWSTTGQVPQHLHTGTYQFATFRPVTAFNIDQDQTLSDEWWLTCDSPDAANISAWDGGEQFPGIGAGPLPFPSANCWQLGFGKPQLDLIRGSTAGDGVCAPAKVIRTPQDLVDWLSGISVLKTSAATTATIAGRPGLTVDTNLNGEVGVSCADRAAPPGGLTLFPTSKELVFIRPGDRARLVVMDIGAPTPLIVRIESPTDVWDTALMRVQAVLDTLAISP